MISALGYAILALLARQPDSGYELARRAGRPLGYFWTARHSQIHPELRKLCDAGYVSFQTVPGPGPRDKKVYSLTDSGRRALREWVPRPPRAEPVRSELLLKTYAIRTADPAAAAALYAAQIVESTGYLAEYVEQQRAIQRRHGGAPPAATDADFGNYATLRYGIGYERHRLDWCRWMLAALTGAASAPDGPSTTASAAGSPGGPDQREPR